VSAESALLLQLVEHPVKNKYHKKIAVNMLVDALLCGCGDFCWLHKFAHV